MRTCLLGTLAIATALWGSAARAEPVPFHRYLYQGWSTDAGLPQISVNAMTRDGSGLLWAGTEDGLARFDGSEFEDLSGEVRALTATSWVTALRLDARGRVWVGTPNGVVIAERGLLRAVPVDGALTPGKVNAIAEDPAGRVCVAAQQLWCTLGDRLVLERDWKGEATALLGTADALWIAGGGKLSHHARGREAKEEALPDTLAGARINALAHDGIRLWIGSTAGLWILEGDGATTAVEGPASSEVRALAVDPQGTVWASTLEAVYRFDGKRLLERLDRSALHDLGSVVSLLAESDGSLWLGSHTDGLQHLWHAGVDQLGRRDGLDNLSVWGYLADATGLLVGTDDGVWELNGDRFTQRIPGRALPNPVACTLLRGRDGRLYVGTRAGLARFSADGRQEHRFAELAKHKVSSLFEEPDGTVWAASHGGLFRIEGDGARRIGGPGELGGAGVRSVLRDHNGVLWAGTETGLFRREGERFVRVAKPGPTGAFILTLLELGDGRLLAGSHGNGLFVKDDVGWRRIGREDGLPSDSVFFMAQYRDTLILSHPNGVYRLALAQLASTAPRPLDVRILTQDVGKQPGRSWLRCCNGGGTGCGTLHGGFAWLASLSGALRVSLDIAAPLPPRTRLRGARQGKRSLNADAGITLAEGSRDLNLRYGAVDFRDATRLRYRYQLAGFDTGWVEAGRRREAFYTNLPAGTYRFAVQVCREPEAWGPVTETPVSVPPLLVERWPFRVGVALVFLCVLALWVRWRETLSRRKQARLEATVAARTGELKAKNEQLETQNAIVKSINERMDFDELLEAILLECRVIRGVEKASALVRLPETSTFTFRAALGWTRADLSGIELTLTETEARYTVDAEEVFEDVFVIRGGGGRAAEAKLRQLAIPKALLVVRIRIEGQVEGYLVFENQRDEEAFDEHDLGVLKGLKEHFVSAFQKARAWTVTEEAKARAEAANQAKGVFLASMSHELRTPLNAVLGFAQLMARRKGRDAEDLEQLAIIARSGEHLLGLINDVLSLSKIEAGREMLSPSTFEPLPMLRALVKMLRMKAESKGLTLLLEDDGSFPATVAGDEGKVRQILLNLLSNAVKFTSRGRVVLRGRWAGGKGVFEVEDTGPGISPAEAEKLFQPFVQTETGRKSAEGTGLGLSISRSFARLMGGDLSVVSEPGKGTVFTATMLMPAGEGGTVQAETDRRRVIGLAPGQGEGELRILVVDDVLENSIWLSTLLSDVGFRVEVAVNGQEAIELWERERPELIFMDVRMPVMDGLTATRRIREAEAARGEKPVRIVALSASVLEHERTEILMAGCDAFLDKPLREAVLFGTLAGLLEVRFVHEESAPSAPPRAEIQVLTVERLTAVSRERRERLREALGGGDDEAASLVAEEIRAEDAELAEALAKSIGEFRLDKLLELIKKVPA